MSFSAAAWRRKTFRKHNLHKNPSLSGRIFSVCQKTYPAESFGGKNSVKGNRHTEPQRGVSERNRRKAAALSAEMGSLSRSVTRRSDQNCKIILQILILQFCRQLVKKVLLDFFDKLKRRELPPLLNVKIGMINTVRTGGAASARRSKVLPLLRHSRRLRLSRLPLFS